MTAGDWDLFHDWCQAAGQPALPTTWDAVQAFLTDVPAAPTTTRRRLGAIRAHHQQARTELIDAPAPASASTVWHTPGDPIDPEQPDGPRWWDLAQALHHLPVHGYPHAVAARRDAVVLLLAARGWTRRQITELTPDQVCLEPVPAIDGIDLGMTNHGLTCPGCALTRWLRVLGSWYDTSGPASDTASQIVEDHPIDIRRHNCADPVPPGWYHAQYLLPVIDRYGHIELGTRIPLRRVTTITATAQHPINNDVPASASAGQPSAPTHSRPAPTPAERVHQLRDLDNVLDQLDTAIAEADRRWGDLMENYGEANAP